MKIRITIEKEYDSDDFYYGISPEVLETLTVKQFEEGIIENFYDYPEELINLIKFKKVE